MGVLAKKFELRSWRKGRKEKKGVYIYPHPQYNPPDWEAKSWVEVKFPASPMAYSLNVQDCFHTA